MTSAESTCVSAGDVAAASPKKVPSPRKCCPCATCDPCCFKCKSFWSGMVAYKHCFKGIIQSLVALLILRPLGMQDENPKVAARIERMALSSVYIFFKCLVSAITEFIKGWRWPAITFACFAFSIPLLLFFSVRWRHVALTTAFLILTICAFGVTLCIWALALKDMIKWGIAGNSPKGGDIFSCITNALLVVALLICSIESLHFVKFIQVTEQKKSADLQAQINCLAQTNQLLTAHLGEMEEYVNGLESVMVPRNEGFYLTSQDFRSRYTVTRDRGRLRKDSLNVSEFLPRPSARPKFDLPMLTPPLELSRRTEFNYQFDEPGEPPTGGNFLSRASSRQQIPPAYSQCQKETQKKPHAHARLVSEFESLYGSPYGSGFDPPRESPPHTTAAGAHQFRSTGGGNQLDGQRTAAVASPLYPVGLTPGAMVRQKRARRLLGVATGPLLRSVSV